MPDFTRYNIYPSDDEINDVVADEGEWVRAEDALALEEKYSALDTKYGHAMKEIGRQKLAYAQLREELERERAKHRPRPSIP